MKIAAINNIKYANNQQYNKNTAAKTPQGLQRGVYNPVYYKDYNIQISFGKRSPEDFYSQDFNRDNMPETMKKYLYAKFEERSKIAPVQIMQEAFDGLESAATVDDIKELFPNEPKFQKLRPANYNNATSGVLKKIKEIKAMQEVPEPLFKDGTDDLTTYLVKKIYLEGKTAKEIDKDFAKDINSVYELAAKVSDETKKTAGKNESVYFSHSTMYNLGIRFPEVPFWNSFIATRDDYERTKRVKTLTGEFVNADSAEGKAAIHQRSRTTRTDKPEPRKYNFKRDRVKNISDTIVNSNGDTQKALKEVKRRGRNPEELTFVQKYLSQIMTLATEKIHLSEEMIYFNESRRNTQGKLDGNIIDKLISGEDLTKRESTPFKEFWRQNPYLKIEFSNAITDSIVQMTDAYGADGNNSYFKLLLEDIAKIKPDREKAKLEHARIQAEYDELAKSLQSEETLKNAIEEAKTSVEQLQRAQEPQKFKYIIDGHEIETTFEIKQFAYKAFENDFTMVPRKIFDIYMREQAKLIKDNPEKFYISCCFEKSDETPEINKVLYTNEELYKISDDLIAEMEINHNAELESCRLTLIEYADRHNLATPEEIKKFANSDILRIRDNLYKKVLETGDVENAHKEIQELFKTVHTPLSNKEKVSIKHKLVQLLKEYNPRNTMSPGTSVPAMIELLSAGMQKPAYAAAIKSLLGDDAIMNFEGPSLRYLLKENINPLFKHLISEHAFKSLIYLHPGDCSIIVTSNAENFVRLMSSFPSELEAIYNLSKRVIANTARLLK